MKSKLRKELDLRDLQPVELETVRQQVTNLVASRAVELVHETIQHIKRGNYQGMKYLFEIVGLFPGSSAETARPDDSLARKLLSYLAPEESAPKGEVARLIEGGKVDANAVK